MFHKVRKLEKKNKEPRQKSIKRYKKRSLSPESFEDACTKIA